MNIFMTAAKKKLRFSAERGTLTAECLWDLPLEELNTLTVELKDVASKTDDAGYLGALSAEKSDSYDKLRFQVAEAIIVTRVEEVTNREQAAANKAERDKILGIIADLENEKLRTEDVADLRARAESLR